MRGEDQQQAVFSYISPEARVPKDHPLRPIRAMVDKALDDLGAVSGDVLPHGTTLNPAGTTIEN
jgi:hypothetical protein